MLFLIAWPTIFLFLSCTGLWITNLYMTYNDLISLPLGLIFGAVLGYMNFTPMHDAAHGSLFSKKFKGSKILEEVVGHISAITLFVPYPAFKILHLQHHSFTNIKEKDPDFWVASQNLAVVILKAFSIKASYYFFVFFKPSKALEKKRPLTFAILIFYIIAIFFFDNSKNFALIWIGTSVLALTILAILFDWLPHTPHDETDRYLNTRIIDKKWLTPIMLYQNYHLIHHLYPRIPFYKYYEKYLEVKPLLKEKNSPGVN